MVRLDSEDDFHGHFAIPIRPKSMSRKQIKAILSCSSVTFGGEAADEMKRNGAGRLIILNEILNEIAEAYSANNMKLGEVDLS